MTQVGWRAGKRIHDWAGGVRGGGVGGGREGGRGGKPSIKLVRYWSSVSSSPRRLGRGSLDGRGRSVIVGGGVSFIDCAATCMLVMLVSSVRTGQSDVDENMCERLEAPVKIPRQKHRTRRVCSREVG